MYLKSPKIYVQYMLCSKYLIYVKVFVFPVYELASILSSLQSYASLGIIDAPWKGKHQKVHIYLQRCAATWGYATLWSLLYLQICHVCQQSLTVYRSPLKLREAD